MGKIEALFSGYSVRLFFFKGKNVIAWSNLCSRFLGEAVEYLAVIK